jgi:membrane-associated phospholipid phosphatase
MDLTALPPKRLTIIGVAIPILWSIFAMARSGFRWDYLGFMIVLPALAFGPRSTHKLFVGLYPIALVGVFYDAMHLIQNVGLSYVHNCDLRAIEMRFFGITMNGERATLHDWLQLHSSPILDAYFAIPYGTFILASIALGVFLYRRDFPALLRFTWTFFFMNVAGFTIYHLYPAAPPWYFHAHGCLVDLGVHASEGPNLARVDGWMGFAYFQGMYGRASDVFGAMPSLHCAYALLIVLESWRHVRIGGRIATSIFFGSMCVAAVYLDHHWVLDVLAGILCAIVVRAIVRYAIAFRIPRAVPT